VETDQEVTFVMSAVHISGEAPGAGTYYCMECGWRVHLMADQELPPCAMCVRPVTSRFYHFR
jgi:hypothetical protein